MTDNHPEHLLLEGLFRSECQAVMQWAPSGIVALQDMRRRPAAELPDVVVIPWMLPMLTAVEFLAEIRSDPSLAQIPVVVFGDVPASEADRLGAAGACAVLGKGITLESLEDAARRLWSICKKRPIPPSE